MFFANCVFVAFCIIVIGLGCYKAYLSWMFREKITNVVCVALVCLGLIIVCMTIFIRFVWN